MLKWLCALVLNVFEFEFELGIESILLILINYLESYIGKEIDHTCV